jgi:hypothetical protein
MNTEQLIENLKNTEPNGLQVSIRKGYLNFTRALFHKKNKIFIFDFDENWNFKNENGNDIEDFSTSYNKTQWIIEDTLY